MALIHCPECGKEVSSYAHQCPNCGFPLGATSIGEPQKQSPATPVTPPYTPSNMPSETTYRPEQHVAPQVESDRTTPEASSQQVTIDFTRMKEFGSHFGSQITYGMMLIGATLHLIISFFMFHLFGGIIYELKDKPIYEDTSLSPWLLMAYAILSLGFVVAVVRRNHLSAISLSISTLIAAFAVRYGITDLIEIEEAGMTEMGNEMGKKIEEWLSTAHILSVVGIFMAGIASVVDKFLYHRDDKSSWKSFGLDVPYILTFLFALLYLIPLIYPEWECKGELREIFGKEFNDYIILEVGSLAAIVGICGVACKRYKVSLMAALFALGGMLTAVFTQHCFANFEKIDYYSERGFDVNNFELIGAPIIAIIIAAALVVILLALINTQNETKRFGSKSESILAIAQNNNDGWLGSLPTLSSLTTFVLSVCGCALSVKDENIWGDDDVRYISILGFDNDVTIYLNIAIWATLFLVVCRQHIGAFITSGISVILLLVIINVVDKVESDTIVYSTLASAIITCILSCYNAVKNHKDTRLNVIVAVLAVCTIFLSIQNLLSHVPFSSFEAYEICTLGAILLSIPLSIMFIYALRRNMLATCGIAAIFLFLLYTVSDNIFDTKEYEYILDDMESDLKGRMEELMLLKNSAAGLLICAILYEPAKRLVAYIKAKQQ